MVEPACAACPVRNGRCVGRDPGRAYVCAMAARSAVEARWVVEASARAAGVKSPAPAAEPAEPPVPPAEPPAPPGEPAVPLADSLRAARLGGRNCPYGSALTCGCPSLTDCALFKRDVSFRDCVRCLTVGPRRNATEDDPTSRAVDWGGAGDGLEEG